MDVMTLSNLSYEDKMAAMDKRISSRAYLDQEIEEEKIDALKEAIDEINKNNENFYLELHGPFKDAGKEVGISSSMFTGTFHYYVTISSEVNYLAQEYYGWYAEEVILLASHLGLGTCWVAGTYKKELVADTALEGQRNDAIIPIGYEMEKVPLKQRTIRRTLVSRNKKPKKLIDSDVEFDDIPDWIKRGLDAVIDGPSAVNLQPVSFSYKDGVLRAHFDESVGRWEAVDFGIAKLHFHLAVDEIGHWDEGQDSIYHLD